MNLTMRWFDERYVRTYTRDTGDWILLGWEAQALLVLAMRKCDRAGIIDTGSNHARGLSAIVGMPLDVVERALPKLLAGEGAPFVVSGRMLIMRNFIEAQEASQSDAQRAREYRARARDQKIAESIITKRDDVVTRENEPSQTVTPCLSVPSLTDPPKAPQGGPKRKPKSEGSEAFEAFWKAYPQHRHVEKAEAIKQWPGDEHAGAIMAALAWQTKSQDWTKEGGSFVPHPKRYLAKRRWLDERPRQQTLTAVASRRMPQSAPIVVPTTTPEERGYPARMNVSELVDRLASEKGSVG